MPQDKQIYSELDKSTWTYVPTLVRWRQRYRGVRESEKINQEMSQILYDIYNADKRLTKLTEDLDTHAGSLYDGKDYVNVDYMYDGVDTAPDTHVSRGYRELSDRLTKIENRVRAQEKANG